MASARVLAFAVPVKVSVAPASPRCQTFSSLRCPLLSHVVPEPGCPLVCVSVLWYRRPANARVRDADQAAPAPARRENHEVRLREAVAISIRFRFALRSLLGLLLQLPPELMLTSLCRIVCLQCSERHLKQRQSSPDPGPGAGAGGSPKHGNDNSNNGGGAGHNRERSGSGVPLLSLRVSTGGGGRFVAITFARLLRFAFCPRLPASASLLDPP